MTAIAFDRTYIASDTRISSANERADNSNKIHDLSAEKVLFKGHRVIAVGTAGNVKGSRGALKALRDKGTAFLEYYEQKAAYEDIGDTSIFSLLIVTDGGVYTFVFNRKGAKVKHCKDGIAAIGSGHRIAYFLIKHFNVSAPMAVGASSIDDPGVGKLVQYRKIVSGVLQKRRTIHYRSSKTIISRLRKQLTQKD